MVFFLKDNTKLMPGINMKRIVKSIGAFFQLTTFSILNPYLIQYCIQWTKSGE